MILVVICARTIISLWLGITIANLKDPVGCALLFVACRLGANRTCGMPLPVSIASVIVTPVCTMAKPSAQVAGLGGLTSVVSSSQPSQ